MVAKRNYVQANRRLAVKTPLADDTLLLRSLNGSEGISRLFQFQLELLSEDDSLKSDQLLGQKISARILLADGSDRNWHGFVSRFSQGGRNANLTSYHAEIVPWLWFLTRTADCRIFQTQTVPEIVQKIFHDLNFQDFELRLYRSYSKRDYCVQYRETDFNFVSRLMEEEGIFYFFDHSGGSDKLILGDDPAAHKPCPNQPKVRYELTAGGWQDDDVVLGWEKVEEFRPGSWAHTDYNFEQPSGNLMVSVSGANPYEIYDYPGEYTNRSDGDSLVKVRLQQEVLPGTVIRGKGDCRAFASGFTVSLEEHYRADMNAKYVITSIDHRATQGGDYSPNSAMAADTEASYRNTFECIPGTVPFRPLRVTPRPTVRGCQTAMVVGPGGEEIYTDKHGRVKVQFHWDREGKRDQNSSCWVRVSHPWAGKGWGAISVPRIGQEVVVDFVEGDPDQPIIVGRVYNGESMPPFGMPGGAVVSGIMSNSTKGGGGNNEISLNDTKGNELINIHAQYDQQKKIEHDERVNVGNDRTESVGHDEKITIGNNRTEKVGVNENITIGSNRTEKVGVNESITVGSNRTESVGANEKITIGSNRNEFVGSNETVLVSLTRTHTVGVNDMLNVGAAQEITVGGLQALTVGAVRMKTVGASETATIGANQTTAVAANQTINIGGSQKINIVSKLTETIGSDHSETVSSSRTASVNNNDSLTVGKNLVISAGDQITITTGDASLSMKKDGTIVLHGKDLTFTGSGKISTKADGDVIVKGQKISHN